MMVDIELLLEKGGEYKNIRKGDFIFNEGAKCNFYFQLIEGRVSWVNFDDDGKVCIQSVMEPGECFGELPLFDDGPYAASAIADQDSVILQLPVSAFHDLLNERPDIHKSFSKLLAQRVRFKFFVVKEMACHNPEQRIATLLNYFKGKDGMFSSGRFRLNYTRQQIAGMTGLRVETVIRAIRSLKEKGNLKIEHGKVYY